MILDLDILTKYIKNGILFIIEKKEVMSMYETKYCHNYGGCIDEKSPICSYYGYSRRTSHPNKISSTYKKLTSFLKNFIK